jgi:hypothetical protein
MSATPGGVLYPSNAGTPVAGQPQTLALDSSGNLKVNVVVGGSGGGTSGTGTIGAAVPSTAVYNGFSNAGGSLTGVSAANPFPVTDTVLSTGEVAQGGAAAATNAFQVAGVYSSTARTLTTGFGAAFALNQAAAQYVDTEGLKNTYSFSATLTPAATPTDILTLSWVSKTVKLRRLKITTLATTAGNMTFQLIKRSAANTGGTSASVTATALNSGNAASTATIALYSANASTLGTQVGSPIETDFIDFGLTASGPTYDRSFGVENAQPPTLIASGQVLAINLNGGTLPTGGQIAISGLFTEE